MNIDIRPVSSLMGSTALALLVLLTGCDRDPEQVWREIEAARGDCTEEALKAGAEECVQMFERLADMGSDAMQTYIGGMRALDQALQRRGGMMFDTAGLGRAMTVPGGGADTLFDGTAATPLATDPSSSVGDWGVGSEAPAGAYDPPGRFVDPVPAPGDPGRREWLTPSMEPTPRSAPAPRGRLLPPEERLRRPWIGDVEPIEAYYPEPAPGEPAADPRYPEPPAGWGLPPEVYPPDE